MKKRDKIFPKFRRKQFLTKNSKRQFSIENRRGIISDYLPWLLIAIAILAILMVTILVLKDKGISLIDSIKNLFR